MLVCTTDDIISLYVWVDDCLSRTEKLRCGRPAILSDSEVVTILIWNSLTTKQKTLKDVYQWIQLYHRRDFPRLPRYQNFVQHIHRCLPQLILVLQGLLVTGARLRFMDSTMLEVCKLVRSDRHKVCKNIADFGKNHQGWHYGFKLHASINPHGQLCGLAITPASYHDAQAMPQILNNRTKIAVGDSAYGAKVMGRHLFESYGTIVIAPPHYKQDKKLMTKWQHKLLTLRPKIEAAFDYLKEHLHLVTSFPRSVMGYLIHYVRILLGYQVAVLG